MTKAIDRDRLEKIFLSGDRRRAASRVFTFDPYSPLLPRSFDGVADDARLRRILKRAVEKTRAPQSLVDSIRSAIRK